MLEKSVAEIKIGTSLITFDKYNFAWSYESKNDNNPSFLELTIPNLSKEFQKSINKNTVVSFSFGSGNSVGVLVTGYVDKKEVTKLDNVTEMTRLIVLDSDVSVFNDINKSYVKNTKSSYIIKDICDNVGLILKQLELKSDKQYLSGYVAYGKAVNIIKKIVSDCKSNIKIDGVELSIYDTTKQSKNSISLIKFGTGLLEEPLPTEWGKDEEQIFDYSVRCIAIANLRKNSIIRVEGSELKFYGKIIEINITDFIATYYVAVMEV